MPTGNPRNNRWRVRALAALFSVYGACVAADPTVVYPPLPLPGPYPVACSDVAQDFTRVAPGENAQDYWDGTPRDDGSSRYITDLLSDPSNTLQVNLAVPANSTLYGSFAGQNFPYVVIVCYPTTANNPRPDYPLPNGVMVPHMQLGTDPPVLADLSAHFPLVLFSHGLAGSPLDDEYLEAIEVPASYGYVVAATFHGDSRFSPLQINDLADVVYLLDEPVQRRGAAGAAPADACQPRSTGAGKSAMARSHRSCPHRGFWREPRGRIADAYGVAQD